MYSAQVYYNSRESHALTPIYPRIGLIETYLHYTGLVDNVDDIKEIVILKYLPEGLLPQGTIPHPSDVESA